jgi:hypothetical protein
VQFGLPCQPLYAPAGNNKRPAVSDPLHSSFRITKEFIMTSIRFAFRNLALAAAATLLCTSAALAANASAMADAQARYRQDMAACASGQSNQDLATCRREAKNALAAAKRGALNNAPDQYQQNALRRCDAHQGEDRIACQARILGEGNVQSGVEAGGILRKSVTVTPAQ